MKKTNAFLFLISSLCLPALAGCDESTSDSDGKTYTYTVNFFDDSETPVQIGYAYIAEGESFKSLKKMDNAEAYDYETRKDTSNEFGIRYTFDKFVGTYADGTTNHKGEVISGDVDLNNILADCNVYATFKKTALEYRVNFKNGNSSFETYENKTFAWGEFASLPTTDPSTDPEWGRDTSFLGYSFNKTDSDLVKKTSPEAKFLHGKGEPSSAKEMYDENGNSYDLASLIAGSFYEDTATMDFYAYSGTWTKIGNFKSTSYPTVNYYAKFNNELRQFTCNFYSNGSKTTLVGSLELDFASNLTFDNETKTITGTYKGVTKTLSYASITVSIKYWYGNYSGDLEVPTKYRGQEISNLSTTNQTIPVMAGLSLWPIYYN